jgi:hypothetical protein
VKLRQVTFAVLLPLTSLVLWVVLIAVPTTLIYLKLRHNAHNASAIRMEVGRFTRTVPRGHFLIFAAEIASTSKAHLIEAVNLPGFAIDVMISRFSDSWPGSWTPSGLLPEQWNAISFPFYCLPFWWFAGTGFDAVFSRVRLKWTSLVLGTFLCSFFLFLVIGLRFGLSAEERKGLTYPFWGFGLWVALFAIFPIASIRQWKASQRKFFP